MNPSLFLLEILKQIYKRRIYVSDPSEAPRGVILYRGERGGIFYYPSDLLRPRNEVEEEAGIRPKEQEQEEIMEPPIWEDLLNKFREMKERGVAATLEEQFYFGFFENTINTPEGAIKVPFFTLDWRVRKEIERERKKYLEEKGELLTEPVPWSKIMEVAEKAISEELGISGLGRAWTIWRMWMSNGYKYYSPQIEKAIVKFRNRKIPYRVLQYRIDNLPEEQQKLIREGWKIIEQTSLDELLKYKYLVESFLRKYFGEKFYLYRGISAVEKTMSDLSQFARGDRNPKKARLYGVFSSFTTNRRIAEEFSRGGVVRVLVTPEMCWGAYFSASAGFLREQEIIVELPDGGLEGEFTEWKGEQSRYELAYKLFEKMKAHPIYAVTEVFSFVNTVMSALRWDLYALDELIDDDAKEGVREIIDFQSLANEVRKYIREGLQISKTAFEGGYPKPTVIEEAESWLQTNLISKEDLSLVHHTIKKLKDWILDIESEYEALDEEYGEIMKSLRQLGVKQSAKDIFFETLKDIHEHMRYYKNKINEYVTKLEELIEGVKGGEEG